MRNQRRFASDVAALDDAVSKTDAVAIAAVKTLQPLEQNRDRHEVTLSDLLPQHHSPARKVSLLGSTATRYTDVIATDSMAKLTLQSAPVRQADSLLDTKLLLSQNSPASELSEPEELPEPLPEPAPVLPEADSTDSDSTDPEPTVPTNTTKVPITDIQVVGSSVFFGARTGAGGGSLRRARSGFARAASGGG